MLLEAQHLSLGYRDHLIIDDLDLALRKGEIVSVIGPNGSGKSTLLKGLSRILSPISGRVLLHGKPLSDIPTQEIARRMAVLPQSKSATMDITVEELASLGRYPHTRFGRKLSSDDKHSIEEALYQTGLWKDRNRPVSRLSGGEQQRAWIAMALAQGSELMLLDEPTTHLDLAHQLEVMETLKQLNRERGTTILMVLHDINQAIRYSDRICALKNGAVEAFCPAAEILSENLLQKVFDIQGSVFHPDGLHPFFIPEKRGIPS